MTSPTLSAEPLPSRGSCGATAGRWLSGSLAFVWLFTGLAVLHPAYRRLGEAYLAPLGLPAWLMYAACAAEVVLGLRVALGRADTWVSTVQALLIAGFTGILSASQPGLWLHPLGVLTKNLALLTLVGAAWLFPRKGGSVRAVRLLRGGMALFWLADGLLAQVRHFGPTAAEGPAQAAWAFGSGEVVLGLATLTLRGPVLRALLAVYAAALVGLTLLATAHDGLLWVHPFGPLTKNVPVLAGTLVLLRCGTSPDRRPTIPSERKAS
jgi:hypothetical protein